MTRSKQIGAVTRATVALVVLVATVCACTPRVKTIAKTIPEGVEAVVADAEKVLREDMRPIRGETRVLVFAIDGLGLDEMRALLASGHGPHTEALIGAAADDDSFERGYLAPDTLSVLPSSTIAAWTTLFTGATPADSGVPGNEFFLRESGNFYAIAPTSVSSRLHALKAINDGLLNSLIEAPTLYEQVDLHAHVSMSQVYRGADLFTRSEAALLELLIKNMASSIAPSEKVERAPFAAIDTESFDSMRDGWEQHGLPDLQVVYLPGLDLFSHVTEQPLQDQPSYYREVIDPFVGQVLREYQQRDALADTWVILVSDHGHTPVIADAEHALEVEDFAAQFEQIGFQLRPAGLEIDAEDFTAVLAAQGGLGFIYLADRSRCQQGAFCDWEARPRWKKDVRPVVEMLERYNRDPEGLNGKLDVILTRNPQDEESSFQVWEDGALHPVADWLKNNDLDHQIDFERRLRELTDGPYGARVGEIVLVPRYGMRYPKEERYYIARPMTSDHGSATLADSRFALLVAHPRKSGAEIKTIVDKVTGNAPRQQHFVSLVKRLLEVD